MVFGRKKTVLMKATAVMALTDGNLELLKAMQMNHINEIPEGAKYIAFLEDGDACFLEQIESPGPFPTINIPTLKMVSYYENVQVQFEI